MGKVMEKIVMDDYLDELVKKYTSKKETGSATFGLLVIINLIFTLIIGAWTYSVDIEQQRRTYIVEEVRKNIMSGDDIGLHAHGG